MHTSPVLRTILKIQKCVLLFNCAIWESRHTYVQHNINTIIVGISSVCGSTLINVFTINQKSSVTRINYLQDITVTYLVPYAAVSPWSRVAKCNSFAFATFFLNTSNRVLYSSTVGYVTSNRCIKASNSAFWVVSTLFAYISVIVSCMRFMKERMCEYRETRQSDNWREKNGTGRGILSQLTFWYSLPLLNVAITITICTIRYAFHHAYVWYIAMVTPFHNLWYRWCGTLLVPLSYE